MYEKVIVIDGKGHLLGRLASIVAKQALKGQKIVIVRAEEINISGPFFRNKLRYLDFLRKRCVVNPNRGAFHFRAPSRILYRTIRGMTPHKTKRGQEALGRIKIFEGIPKPYDKMKKMIIPQALRILKLSPGRKFTVLARISKEMGWKYNDVINELEQKRKINSSKYYQRKLELNKLKEKAIKSVDQSKLKALNQVINP